MNRNRLLRLVLVSCFPILLSGCWDAKEIQDNNYISALGIDFVNGRYIVHAQLLDFTSVAKQEGGKPSESARVWVSKSTGASINEAVNKMYQSSQQYMLYAHVNAIVYSEAALRHGPQIVYDLTNRYREIRYTKWVYGTTEPLDQLLTVTPFFNESPIASILNEPKATYKQSSYVKPLQFQRYLANYNEQGRTTLLPYLSINKSTWKENLEKHSLLEIGGAMIIDHGTLRGSLNKENLKGLRWVTPHTVRAFLNIKGGTSKQGELVGTFVIRKPKVRIEPLIRDGRLAFNLHIRLAGSLNELGQNVSEAELIALAKKEVAKEIKATYLKGIAIKADIYQLGYALLLQSPAQWNTYFGSNAFPLTEHSIEAINIQMNIDNTGKYKLRT
ncbi:Ger(x)C family spore germination protein [Paenibacillus rigui]|uniref:Uncharacterized protein n=1 Tax=Paenibacillus rigui TaxID=554312 RepID=A0A229UU80_9BACL|nr:Ger(x)C family spore germination protein [Paenibacillus rigui]OXM86962.1 hypothetical protein CF651_07410 [Paenibacillus rigui]